MSDTTTTVETASAWPAQVMDVLQRQESIVGELTELAAQQGPLVEQRRTDALLRLLTRRQRLIERFAATQEELATLTDDASDGDAGLEAGERDRIRALIDGIGARLAAVIATDERDQRVLESARDEHSGDLATLGTVRQARNAYRAGTTPARFADRQG